MSDFSVDLDKLCPKPTEVEKCLAKKLGSGSFGMVYAAEYESNPVAVKKLHTSDPELTKDEKTEFKKEVKVMQDLDHENVVHLFGYAFEPFCILVMERAEASLYSVLQDRIRYPSLPWRIRLSLVRDIAKGIQYLHSQAPPIIHRDLKASNALLAKNWRVFLTDFGLAKIKSNPGSMGSKGKGTPRWMSPEALEEDLIETPAMDIYGFGMVLYEVLTRQIPFSQLTNIYLISKKVSKGERPEIPQEEDKSCPGGYRKLMEECWAHNPKDRPQIDDIVKRLDVLIEASTDQQLCSTVTGGGICQDKNKDHQESFFHQIVERGSSTAKEQSTDLKKNTLELHQAVLLNTNLVTVKHSVRSPSWTSSFFEYFTPKGQQDSSNDLITISKSPLELIELAHKYRTGTGGIQQNHQEALRLYRQAELQGNNEAEAWTAYCYLMAEGGVKPNDKESFRLSELGVKKNIPLAYNNLGFCYLTGRGVKKDLQKGIQLYRRSIELGDIIGLNNLGICYQTGIGVEKNIKEAIRLYRLGAERGDASAQHSLGICSQNGIGIEQDIEEALRLYRLSVEQGNLHGHLSLGRCYENGTGVEKDAKEAVRLYRIAVEKGVPFAYYCLGACYQNGIGVSSDLKEAIRLYRIGVDKEDSYSQNTLGICYQDGNGVEKDAKEAIRLYRLSAAQGDLAAQNNLADCYRDGIGISQDVREAVRLYQLSAQQGNAIARNSLGFCYQNGIGVKKNVKEAVRLYQIGVEQGLAFAQNNLGVCYQNGIGVEMDLNEACQLYRLSAEQGLAVAQYHLGRCYHDGDGVERDAKEAFRLYALAAKQGQKDAQYQLGLCYERGFGTKKNTNQALEWYIASGKRGHQLDILRLLQS